MLLLNLVQSWWGIFLTETQTGWLSPASEATDVRLASDAPDLQVAYGKFVDQIYVDQANFAW